MKSVRTKGQTIWFAGHSLGAALATLAARDMSISLRPEQVFTFGSPRCGNPQFAAAYKVPLKRFVNENDIITHVPLQGLFTNLKYCHVGHRQLIMPNGQITSSEAVWTRQLREVAKIAVLGVGAVGADALRSHSMTKYVAKLRIMESTSIGVRRHDSRERYRARHAEVEWRGGANYDVQPLHLPAAERGLQMTIRVVALGLTILLVPQLSASLVRAQSAAIPAELPREQQEEAFKAKLSAGISELEETTPNFVGVCRELASAIQAVLDDAKETKDVGEFKKKLSDSVHQKLAKVTIVDGDTKVFVAWREKYNGLVEALEEDPAQDTVPYWSSRYKIAVDVLTASAAESPTAPPANSLSDDVLSVDKQQAIVDEIAKLLVHDDEAVFWTDKEYPKTVRKLISAIDEVRSWSASETAVAIADYKQRTNDAVAKVVQETQSGTMTRVRWKQAYDVFNKRVEDSELLDDTEVKDWDRALAILVVGLKKTIGISGDILAEASKNQKPQPGGNAARAAGGSTGVSGGTRQAVWTARKIQRIQNRAAVRRAQIQRIRGY
jgi:hypothetical protein